MNFLMFKLVLEKAEEPGDDAESEDAAVGETEDHAGEGVGTDGVSVQAVRQAVFPKARTGGDNG